MVYDLHRMVREDLTEKVTFEKRFGGSETYTTARSSEFQAEGKADAKTYGWELT